MLINEWGPYLSRKYHMSHKIVISKVFFGGFTQRVNVVSPANCSSLLCEGISFYNVDDTHKSWILLTSLRCLATLALCLTPLS